MRRVRAKDTKPEVALRKMLFSLGLRYRLHVKELFGTPDIVLARYRSVIFINGCFWHWHGCRRSRMPAENAQYWKTKIERNKIRDRANYQKLFSDQWRVLVIWECALKKSCIDDAGRLAAEWIKGKDSFGIIEPQKDSHSQFRLLCISR